MDPKTFLKSMDITTKMITVAFITFVIYLLSMFILKPIIMAGAIPSHSNLMGDHIMNFTSPKQQELNAIAILIALAVGLVASLMLRTVSKENPSKHPAPSKEEELRIVKKALSPDEKKMLEEIEKAGEITQESLRFRLDWSKAKVSAKLLTLEKMDLVQRERQGKTYNVLIKK